MNISPSLHRIINDVIEMGPVHRGHQRDRPLLCQPGMPSREARKLACESQRILTVANYVGDKAVRQETVALERYTRGIRAMTKYEIEERGPCQLKCTSCLVETAARQWNTYSDVFGVEMPSIMTFRRSPFQSRFPSSRGRKETWLCTRS